MPDAEPRRAANQRAFWRRSRSLAAIAGTYLIVQQASRRTKHKAQVSATTTPLTRPQRKSTSTEAKFYVVQPGDTLERIAAKTGISVATLERSIRRLDPNALQTGQRLRLRR